MLGAGQLLFQGTSSYLLFELLGYLTHSLKFVFNCFLCDLNTIKLHFLTLKYTWRRAFPEKKIHN